MTRAATSSRQSPARWWPARLSVLGADRLRGLGPDRRRLYAIWLLVVVSLVSWRNGVYFSGGLDPVVAAKALLALFALGLAIQGVGQAGHRYPVGTRSVVIVCCYVAVTTLGGWASGSVVATAVLSVRVLILTAVVVLVLTAYPVADATRGLFGAMALVGLVSVVTGIGSLATRGRLYGGLFPLNPNNIALLVGAPLLGVCWRMLNGRGRWYDPPVSAALAGIMWLTGSRTGLVALLIGVLVMVLQARRIPVVGFIGSVAALPAIAYVVSATPAVAEYFDRGGSTNVTSLNSRTIAWTAAFTMQRDFWNHWFGGGLDVMTIPVTGTYWDTQVVDSSWVSAWVQAGIIGIALLAFWVVVTVAAAARAPQPWRLLWSGMTAFCVVVSTTMSGLLDSQLMFVLFFLTAIATEPVRRREPDIPRPARAGEERPLSGTRPTWARREPICNR